MVVSRVGILTSNILRCQIPLGQPAAPPGGKIMTGALWEALYKQLKAVLDAQSCL